MNSAISGLGRSSEESPHLDTLEEVVNFWRARRQAQDFHDRLRALNSEMTQLLDWVKKIEPASKKIELVIKNKAGTEIAQAYLEEDNGTWWVGGALFQALVGPGYYTFPTDLNTVCAKTGLYWEVVEPEVQKLLTGSVSGDVATVVGNAGPAPDSPPAQKRGGRRPPGRKTVEEPVPAKSAPAKPTAPVGGPSESTAPLTPTQQAYAELLGKIPDGTRTTVMSNDRQYFLTVEKNAKGDVTVSVTIKVSGKPADVAPDTIKWNTKWL